MLCAAEFEKALGKRPCAKSPHFLVHYLVPMLLSSSRFSERTAPSAARIPTELEPSPEAQSPTLSAPSAEKPAQRTTLLGMVVPKRYAPKAATRNLIKRQIRAIFSSLQRGVGLAEGAWVVRLRAPFERTLFISAQSTLLTSVVRSELTELLQSARDACKPSVHHG